MGRSSGMALGMTPWGPRGGERDDPPRDALEVARGLRRRAVDEERLVPADREPHGVVVLDVAELVEGDAVVARERSHICWPRSWSVRTRVWFTTRWRRMRFASIHARCASSRSTRVSARTSSNRSGEEAELPQGAVEEAQAEAVGVERASEAAHERGAQEAVGRLDGGRLRDRNDEARSAASIRSTANGPWPGPTSTTRYSAGMLGGLAARGRSIFVSADGLGGLEAVHLRHLAIHEHRRRTPALDGLEGL